MNGDQSARQLEGRKVGASLGNRSFLRDVLPAKADRGNKNRGASSLKLEAKLKFGKFYGKLGDKGSIPKADVEKEILGW